MSQSNNLGQLGVPFNYHRDSAAAPGTYAVGDILGYGNDDGLIKVMSASNKLACAGVCQQAKTTTADDPQLHYSAGIFTNVSASSSAPPTSLSVGKVVYASGFGTSFAVTLTAGTNPIVGRVFDVDALGNAFVHVDHHLFPSGTL